MNFATNQTYPPPRTKAVRTLVVDDSPDLLEVFCALLAKQPEIEVVGTAENGVEALRRSAKLHPDLVLMDVTMPEMDGVTAASLMAKFPNRPHVILMSSDDRCCGEHELDESGAEAFIFKPRFRQQFPSALEAMRAVGAN
ncbi:MAG TPA: response regulator [Candidatus Angelobacter sp.]